MDILARRLAGDRGETATRVRQNRDKHEQMERIIKAHVAPCLPRSLAAYWSVANIGPGFSYPLRLISIRFEPARDMSMETDARAALGTIDKLAAALEKLGWAITERPAARPHSYKPSMDIELKAAREIRSRLPRFLDRGTPPVLITLSVTFGGVQATDRCHLVEKEVIIAAVAEHTEKRMVVECDEEPTA